MKSTPSSRETSAVPALKFHCCDMTSQLLQFQPFASTVRAEFWHNFSSLKIDALQLSDEHVPLRASYTIGRSVLDRNEEKWVNLPPSFVLDGQAFERDPQTGGVRAPSATDAVSEGPSKNSSGSPRQIQTNSRWQASIPMTGYLKNYNTVEEFKQADKSGMFDELAAKILHVLSEGENPEAYLNRFFVLAFADLKKFKFYYWFAFPAIIVQPAWHIAIPQISASSSESANGQEPWSNAAREIGLETLKAIDAALPAFAAGGKRKALEIPGDTAFNGAFLVRHSPSSAQLGTVMDYATFFAHVPDDQRIVAFIDPSSHPTQPGWPLRNLLLLLRARFQIQRIRVLRWLDESGAFTDDAGRVKSLVGTVVLPEETENRVQEITAVKSKLTTGSGPSALPIPQATGWERNARGALAPKVSDLGPLMDPTRLADQAVDLNLKLMRWRIMPEIQLDKVQRSRCLLFGAGTLGCYVARTLMGWGVRNITLVDNARVSYSNPVRQPLFDFEDCLEGGKPKAHCAAAKLKKIYPGIKAEGHMLAIPMPGHPIAVGLREQMEKDLTKIERLVDRHDVVFLLMDSRESRWLPSLLGAAKGKLVINAALGFDTYLVMRHGAGPEGASSPVAVHSSPAPIEPGAAGAKRLGCYFCNDIVAPSDSLADRTLDQMCTVSRPGLAAIAGASAVELMISVLQHKYGVRAPASISQPPGSQDSAAASGSCLGLIPHQIRGFLAQFNNMLITGQSYDRCTACSSTVVQAYKVLGHDLVLKACNEEGYLEELTGLKQMYEETEQLEKELEVDWSDDEGESEL
ncbi:E1-like protein-activating [Tilletiaria anomala UBC 951]|uniref:Ubiquitin-like modifier-activating enzyme ATG7 n=1 Tax=Tilletiaria anomala (strain ATCC 24038 / CBS 436.72 / UBC 951) TaxID=1037660 RepID=A0A066VGI0_TILAU|nr:E1-like protein-activating [Tilletiaria anomala UBC 951]KDN39393.1 E1-like protein-activating [Tilletiaria anomala UBC 951]